MSTVEKFIACLILLLAAIGVVTVSAVVGAVTSPCSSIELKHHFLPVSWSKVPEPHCAKQGIGK